MAKRRSSSEKEGGFSRVYFLGAGFSAGAGYPVGATLLPNVLRWVAKRSFFYSEDRLARQTILDCTRELLSRYLGKRTQAKRLSTVFRGVNVAEFYSIAHAIAEMPRIFDSPEIRSRSNGQLSQLFNLLSAATRSYFHQICTRKAALPPDMDSMLNEIDENRHAIVNFNWDEEVDILLSTWESDRTDDEDHIAYTKRAWDLSNKKFLHLKPHGSVGWYDVRNGIANEGVYFISDGDDRIDRNKKSLVAYSDVELPIDFDDSERPELSCPPVITAPTFSKRFTYPEQEAVWQDVLAVCNGVKEFVFVGYQLPPDDFLTRAAIIRSRDGQGEQGVKCLFVGNTYSERVENSFRSVFPSFDKHRNFFKWTFGSRRSQDVGSFAKRLEAAIDKANLTAK